MSMILAKTSPAADMTSSSHFVTSHSATRRATRPDRPPSNYVTDIPDVCRHNVYFRCAVAPPREVVGSTLVGCDFSTCGNNKSRGRRDGLEVDDDEEGGLGHAYYDRMCELIDRQLELDTGDRVCYVGDGRRGARTIVAMLIERYCLVQPVVLVDTALTDESNVVADIVNNDDVVANTTPAVDRRTLTSGPRLPFATIVPRRLDDVFALNYSRSRDESCFDKIVVVDALRHFLSAAEHSSGVGTPDHLTTAVLQLMKPLSADGHLLIVHRPARLNTLPLPSAVLDRQRAPGMDVPLERIVSTVESLGLELRWSIDRVPVVTSRRRWIGLVGSGFPSTRTVDGSENDDSAVCPAAAVRSRDSTDDVGECPSRSARRRTYAGSANVNDGPPIRCPVHEGIEELTGGLLRYAGDDTPVEFVDRLAFVSVTRHSAARQRTTAQLYRQRPTSQRVVSIPGLMEMDVTSELARYVDELQAKKDNKPNLFR